jgi:hypothetical protein
MDVSAAENDIPTVISCLEALIEFVGQAFPCTRAATAASEQVCEDFSEAIRFLEHLPIVEVSNFCAMHTEVHQRLSMSIKVTCRVPF